MNSRNGSVAICKSFTSKPRGGFTLLELLLVVFILSALALSAVSFTNNADEQFRFEDTRTRLGNIRTAVIGQPTQMLNGSPAVSGFAADVGRLPTSLQELIKQGSLPAWCFYDASSPPPCNIAVGLWAGWRGPYLTTLTEQSSGTRAFRDGWGNVGGVPNYGWAGFSAVDIDAPPDGLADTLTVQSLGSDGAAGGSGYQADYPASGSLVERHDHQLNLRGWTVTVTFSNPLGGTDCGGGVLELPCADQALRLRLFYPRDGSLNWQGWPPPNGDNEPYVSLAITLPANAVADNSSLSQAFDFGAVDKFVPWGTRALAVVLDIDGTNFVPSANQSVVISLVPRSNLPMTMNWNLE